MKCALRMLEIAHSSAADLDMILLSGGLSHIPRISELLKQKFGENTHIIYLSDDALANGVARWRHLLMNNHDSHLFGPERQDLPLDFWGSQNNFPGSEVFTDRQSNGNSLLPVADIIKGAREEQRQISYEENSHGEKKRIPLSTGEKNCYQDDVKIQDNNDSVVAFNAEITHSESEATATVTVEEEDSFEQEKKEVRETNASAEEQTVLEESADGLISSKINTV